MIAYVYRSKRKTNGRLKSSRVWRGRVKLSGELKVRDIALGVTDKQVAEQKLHRIVLEHEKESVGIIAPAAQREAFGRALERLVAEYVADLVALGRSQDHVRHVDKRLRRLMRECGWRNLGDATPVSFLTWRSAQDQAPKTLNEYLAALSAFCTWLRKQGRIVVNHFENISKVDTRGKERLQRRALSDKEAQGLLRAPEPRRTVYLFAMHTGLRRGEINALRWDDLKLNGASPSIRVRAATSKNRREQSLPLHPELTAPLQALKGAAAGANDCVFAGGVPAMKVMREDFKAGGIALSNECGQRVDFHALRKTYITRLQLAGVSPREAMELARHSDMRLTMKTYTDTAHLPLAATVAKLPAFGATGNRGEADTHIDTQTLVSGGHAMSPADLGIGETNCGESFGNIGESHGQSIAVTAGHRKSEWRREGDSNPRYGF
jgi:integrase